VATHWASLSLYRAPFLSFLFSPSLNELSHFTLLSMRVILRPPKIRTLQCCNNFGQKCSWGSCSLKPQGALECKLGFHTPKLVSRWLGAAPKGHQCPGTPSSVSVWAKWLQRSRVIFRRGVSDAGHSTQKDIEAGRGGAQKKTKRGGRGSKQSVVCYTNPLFR